MCYKVKHKKENLQIFFHPSSANQLISAQVQCREPKKVSKRFKSKKTTGLCPSIEVSTLWEKENEEEGENEESRGEREDGGREGVEERERKRRWGEGRG